MKGGSRVDTSSPPTPSYAVRPRQFRSVHAGMHNVNTSFLLFLWVLRNRVVEQGLNIEFQITSNTNFLLYFWPKFCWSLKLKFFESGSSFGLFSKIGSILFFKVGSILFSQVGSFFSNVGSGFFKKVRVNYTQSRIPSMYFFELDPVFRKWSDPDPFFKIWLEFNLLG